MAGWTTPDLSPSCRVVSVGLACFAEVTETGYLHQPIIVGGRKPQDLPKFNWVNTILGNLKTSFGRAYPAFDFAKYGKEHVENEQGQFNDRGYVSYHGTMGLDELMQGNSAQNMGFQMGGIQ